MDFIHGKSSYTRSVMARNNIMSQEKMMKNSGNSTKKSGGGRAVKLSTDPQSVAARERRHRISDRFKILQSLVPGGTKMDTVSMLDEAIHYVKYLKTQIWLHQTMFVTDHFNIQLDDSSINSVLMEDPSSSPDLPYSQGHYGHDQQHALLYYPRPETYNHNQQPSSSVVVVQQTPHQESLMMMQPYSFQEHDTMLVHDNYQHRCFNY